MRQSVLLPLLLAALLPLTACARAEEAPETPEADGTAVKQVRLVDTAQDGSLIVAGEARGDVLTLSPDEVSILWDGVERSPEALRDGMLLEVGYGGTILETYPAQFYQPRSITVLEEGEDLCGLYLQVLNDLWADALGGESGVETIGVDASALEGLSEGETDAMAYAFGMAHQTGLPLRGTFDELTEQGYIEPAGDGARPLARRGSVPPGGERGHGLSGLLLDGYGSDLALQRRPGRGGELVLPDGLRGADLRRKQTEYPQGRAACLKTVDGRPFFRYIGTEGGERHEGGGAHRPELRGGVGGHYRPGPDPTRCAPWPPGWRGAASSSAGGRGTPSPFGRRSCCAATERTRGCAPRPSAGCTTCGSGCTSWRASWTDTPSRGSPTLRSSI